MTSAQHLYGLVLAGGKSRRMGQDKALLQREGRSQIENVFALLQPVTDRQFVSARREQFDDPERGRFPQIVDRYDDIGPVAGILSAMDEHPVVDWLVVACDLPNLDNATLRFLIDRISMDKPFTAYRSSYDGLPEPLCAVYRSGSESLIRGFVDDGLVCPRKMLIRAETELLQLPNPAALDNINTPDDLAESILQASR